MNELQGLKNELTFITDGVKNINERLCNLQNRIEDLSAQPLSSKYPMRLWPMELKHTDLFIAGRSIHSKYFTFIRLVETCREWNKVDGFVPDWTNNTQRKYCIFLQYGELAINEQLVTYRVLYFSRRETTQLFLDTFRTEIESVKELI